MGSAETRSDPQLIRVKAAQCVPSIMAQARMLFSGIAGSRFGRIRRRDARRDGQCYDPGSDGALTSEETALPKHRGAACPMAKQSTDDVGTAPAHTSLPQPVKNRIFFYLGVLIVLMAFGSPHGGLIDIPLSFVLKNKLDLAAHELAQFRLIAGSPLYLSFVFGFLRDTW